MANPWTERDVADLTGKVAVVTGANAGLGEQAAGMLARQGATVVLACRNVAKAHEAAARIRTSGATGALEVVALDLASLASVRKAADEIGTGHERIDLLINNAGLMAVAESRTEDGFEMQIGVNHLGHFALTAALAARLVATPGSRVVTVSSEGHRAGRINLDDLMFERRRYSRWLAYFQSKLANLLFAIELNRRLTEAGASTVSLAAHPGFSHTELGTKERGLLSSATALVMPLGQSANAGALPLVRAATDPGATGGQFYGPNLRARGHPIVETPSRRARDAEMARRLWETSSQLTATTPNFQP